MYIMRWEVVWENLPNLLAGLVLGLEVAVGSIFIGAMIGLVAAFARTSSNRVLQRSVAAYVEFVRNLPLLLIIFFVSSLSSGSLLSARGRAGRGLVWGFSTTSI